MSICYCVVCPSVIADEKKMGDIKNQARRKQKMIRDGKF